MNYTVKAGDTLARIAKLNGITLSQLLDANPQFKSNPNQLKVGAVLNIPDELTTAVTRPLAPPPPTVLPTTTTSSGGAVGTALAIELGSLSAKYETSGRGPGTVSTGSGDPGGVSYGSYQMATKTGTVARFVSQSNFPWRVEFQNLTPGTAGFTSKWKQIAASEPIDFQRAQHDFIKKSHYDLLVVKTLSEDQLDVNRRSRALQNAVWSTAVQHGGASSVVHNALAKVNEVQMDPGFDEALIRAIYAERGRKRSDGNLALFSKSSPGVQSGVAKRFQNELSDALKMLATET
jgi:LysM repeat protein